jgi:hypothetical protein
MHVVECTLGSLSAALRDWEETNMPESATPFFVVVREGTVGSHAVAVFTSEDKATRFLEHAALPDATVETHHAQGSYRPGEPVFAVEEYDEVLEARHYVGLYADERAARQNAGIMGHVLRFLPDAGPGSGTG